MAASSNSDIYRCELCLRDKATSSCRECNQIICDSCLSIHNRGSLNSDHRVTDLYGADGILYEKCETHGKPLYFRCGSCPTELCVQCFHAVHGSREILPNKKFTFELGNAKREAEKAMLSKNARCEMEKSFELFKKSVEQTMRNVTKEADECKANIEREEEEIKGKVEQILMTGSNKFEKTKEVYRKFEEMEYVTDLLIDEKKMHKVQFDKIVELVERFSLLRNGEPSLKEPDMQTLSFPILDFKPLKKSGTKNYLGELVYKDDNCCNFEIDPCKGKTPCKPSVLVGITHCNGHMIFIYSGDIGDIPSEVYINFVDGDMSSSLWHNSVISKAGPRAQEELLSLMAKPHYDKQNNKVIATSAGNASCKQIIHCILPKNKSNESLVRHKIKEGVLRALKHSQTMIGKIDSPLKHFSISVFLDDFSFLKIPSNWMAGAVFEDVIEYFQSSNHSNSMKINFVGRDKTILGLLTSKIDLVLQESVQKYQFPIMSFPSGFQLEVHLGSIVDEKVDAILIAVHPSFNLNKGVVSQEVLRAAGRALQEECNQIKYRCSGASNFIVTRGYNLKCKHVFLGNIQGVESIQKILMESLSRCCYMNLTSLALPALGTGSFLDGNISAALILEQIRKFGMQFSIGSSLEKVVVVLHPACPKTLEAFSDHMKALDQSQRVPMWTPFIDPNSDQDRIVKNPVEGASKEISNGEETDLRNSQELVTSSVKDLAIDKTGTWSYKDTSGTWVDYPGKINSLLEKHFKDGKEAAFWNENGKVFEVSFLSMRENIFDVDDSVEIRRM